MEGDGFLRRWSRLKSGAGTEARSPARIPVVGDEEYGKPSSHEAGQVLKRNESGAAAVAGTKSAPPSANAVPTMEDAMHLTPDSDYSAFVARGVDKAVRRLALKKLFADPHFNQVDGLDIYMGDYNRADPLPASMLAALRQARDFLQEDAAPDDNDSGPSPIADIKSGTTSDAVGRDRQPEDSEPGRNES